MTAEQRSLMAGKLKANHQRRMAREFLTVLSPPLQQVFAQARLAEWPESDEIKQHHLFDQHGIGPASGCRPSDYSFREFLSPEGALGALQEYGDRVDSVIGYFRPKGFFIRTNAGPVGGDELFFEITFKAVLVHMAELHRVSEHICGITTVDGKLGLLTDVVCGHPGHHADTPVYEVACWGDHSA